LLISGWGAGAAEKSLAGREIFRQQCAKCHGRNGEGVKGKYEDPLQGERSLAKLTRYIERNMPDDKPGTCVGRKAEAVAGYIYNAFYSREARGIKPPRIELARLTNRQYLNSVADLLKEFTGGERDAGGERGLRAVYYDSKNFNDDKKAIERVDRAVDFDYGEGRPDPKLANTNGFSVQWRGSLRADETGDYELILKTPNGARLWLNDEEEPLVDAWVSSGQDSEHKARIRLIGGRVYPMKLDYFKSKEKLAGISLRWNPPHGTEQPIPARNLLPARSSPTLVITTPFPPDDSSLGYERGVSISKAWDEATTSAAIEAAKYVADHLDRLSNSKPADTNRSAKVEEFCLKLVAAGFHRPLDQEEKRRTKLQNPTSNLHGKLNTQNLKSRSSERAPKKGESLEAGQQRLEDAVRRVVLYTLKSPRFLYRGLDDDKPDDYDVAARLSYGLWDSLPDSRLRKLAAEGALRTREQVAEQARRMLGDSRTHAKMQYFFHHWLQVDRAENLAKDNKVFPGFTPEIIGDLRTSLNFFLEDTMWNEAADYRKLLTADYLFLNNRMAAFYGLSTNDNGNAYDLKDCDNKDDFVKVTFGSEPRCGVLTHPFLLASLSYQKMTSPIHRGVFLTRHIVGRSLKPPPMAMTFKDADFAPNLTMRQKVAELTRPQACQSCHSVINPLGFSLEQYDAVGRFRASENDKLIDPVSEYLTDDGEKIRLGGARDVAAFAIGSEQAQNAFIQEMFHQIVKQPVAAYGADMMASLRKTFVESDFNMQKLLVEIVTVAALHGTEKTTANRPGRS
jgi:hypothetical protein